jgi:REP element-mobilizing transposase RayT
MKTQNKQADLLPEKIYHVYNRAVGNELLFTTDNDYLYFLKKFERFLHPYIEVYSYCLLPNHFHFLLGIKEFDESEDEIKINKAFSKFFISYARSYNNSYNRLGRLFCQPFKRILVEDDDYFRILVNYVHRNPIHHGLVKDYRNWRYSSFNAYLSDKQTKIEKRKVLEYFYSLDDFISFHEENKSKIGIEKLYLE